MSNQEQTIRSYLLGELAESEQATLEQQYFQDQRLFEQMVQVENDLVDKYVRGLLSPEMRDRFENHYMAHSQRKDRARFAEALAAKIGGDNRVQPIANSASWWDRFATALRGPRLAWGLSIAILLFAVLAGWFFIESRRLRRELARIESERLTREDRERALQQQVASEQLRSDKLSEELERLRTQQGVAQPSPSPERASTFATLILMIGTTRSVETGPAGILRISSETEQVRLQLKLRENNYAAYQVAIQLAGGNTIFSSKKLNATGNNLSLTIPASKFTSGDYIVTLRGATSGGEFEDVNKSLIRVEKK